MHLSWLSMVYGLLLFIYCLFFLLGWFDVDTDKSSHVYISGLPSDITEDEFKDLVTKCGLIMIDPITHKWKLKLYYNKDGTPKGDGLCCYIKVRKNIFSHLTEL